MALSPEQAAHINRQARRRAERAAAEMSFRNVSSEDYLRKLRAKRRPSRPFEIGEIPAAVEIEDDEPVPPPRQSNRASTASRPALKPRAAATGGSIRGHNKTYRAPTPTRTREATKSPKPTRSSTRVSVRSPVPSREQTRSQDDLLKTTQQSSTTTLGSIKSRRRSILSPSRLSFRSKTPSKPLRRAASAAEISSKTKPAKNETLRPNKSMKHTRSQSTQSPITPSELPGPKVGLTKRSSLRSLKDKIRRVASAFELRSDKAEGEGGSGVSLKHNNSTRSLLRYSGTRLRRRQLDTVDEEA
ncbi:hypothetical protein CMUS01_11162 [Colletotrichum musicola]|uniref:Uncharacterized protein n=1 Tax=Colletotrichum musicola TaxID=2175873 RepID=A0A8H6K0X5_9PEZI|nr:hypothetical protein CMUS01_11162 [Colletotrichum musicola]